MSNPYIYDSLTGELLKECEDHCDITDGCTLCPDYGGDGKCAVRGVNTDIDPQDFLKHEIVEITMVNGKLKRSWGK